MRAEEQAARSTISNFQRSVPVGLWWWLRAHLWEQLSREECLWLRPSRGPCSDAFLTMAEGGSQQPGGQEVSFSRLLLLSVQGMLTL